MQAKWFHRFLDRRAAVGIDRILSVLMPLSIWLIGLILYQFPNQFLAFSEECEDLHNASCLMVCATTLKFSRYSLLVITASESMLTVGLEWHLSYNDGSCHSSAPCRVCFTVYVWILLSEGTIAGIRPALNKRSFQWVKAFDLTPTSLFPPLAGALLFPDS